VNAPVTTYYAPSTTVSTPVTTYYAPSSTVTYRTPVTAYYAPSTRVYSTPVTTYYAPAATSVLVPRTTYYAPSSVYLGSGTVVAPTLYRPAWVGASLGGGAQPYVAGQPIRNALRWVTP
jgi:hypothetical protein